MNIWILKFHPCQSLVLGNQGIVEWPDGRKKTRGSGAVRKTLRSEKGAETTRVARNGQNGTEKIGEVAELPRKSLAAKWIENGKEAASTRRDKSSQKNAKQPGRLDDLAAY